MRLAIHAERGLLVSEFVPGTPPLPHHFPQRNRIMAALARVVVVVEAAERSGALITADLATHLERDVFVVPGPIDAPTAAGSNALLLVDDIEVALGPEEILPALGLEAPGRSVRSPSADGDGAALWSALDVTPLGLDELSARSGLPSGRALAALALLELDGWAVQSAGGRFARRGF